MTPCSTIDRIEPEPTRVVIIDDMDELRSLLRLQIGLEKDLEVVGEGTDGAGAAGLAAECRADVVVMDMMMPGMTGIEAVPGVKGAAPEAGVIIYSSRRAAEFEGDAIAAGADAYVEKATNARTLIAAIRGVATRHLPH